jgi:serine/threonine-protein kinase HipA
VKRRLLVLLDGEVAGQVWQDGQGGFRFAYEEAWREDPAAYPLSLSIPIPRREHGDPNVRAYLAGLLPDSERVLDQWGRRFKVSARNPLALLEHVGEDCPGAVQFVAPGRLRSLRSDAADDVRWLDEAEVAARLRRLREDQVSWLPRETTGYFSLPGAQPKTAFLHEDGRWGRPSGRVPTTHILKPPLGDFDGFAENEHLCLRLAARLRIPAARSTVMTFEDETAIVVERYDRRRSDGRWIRIHQEDFCQALSIAPHDRYEAEGGPGLARILATVRDHSSTPEADEALLVDALAMNWVIAGTDAHAKNYSILLAADGQVRLAPIYDVISALPYPTSLPWRRLKFAMHLGGEYLVWKTGRRHWVRFAESVALDPEAVIARVAQLVEEVPDAMAETGRDAHDQGLDHPIIRELQAAVIQRSKQCRAALVS